MKMSSKILMIVLLLLSFSLPLTDRAYAMAQISLQNNSKFWLYLYIDGNFGCGPVMPSGFCTSSVKEGSHRLEARKGGDPSTTIMYEPSVNIGDGTSPTWTVNYEEPATVEGVWEVISVNLDTNRALIGSRLTILKKEDGYYEARTTDGSSMNSGNATRITRTYQKKLSEIIAEDGTFPPSLVPLVAGIKVPLNVSFTLSDDGNVLQQVRDRVGVYYRANPVIYDHYETFPGLVKITYKRISGPVFKPTQ
jgi:hypothetical protein